MPAEPHTDTSSFLLSQQEADRLNSGDWAELAALYNVYAPLSVGRSQDAIDADPLAAAESVPDTGIAVHEGDLPVIIAHDDRHTADGSRLTEDDVITGVIHLVSSL